MSCKMFIRGEREPIILTDDEGRTAEKFKADPNVPRSAVFSIQGVWTGEKGDMKSILFEKERVYGPSAQAIADAEIKKEMERRLKLKPRARTKCELLRFHLGWFSRSGFTEKYAPEKVVEEFLKAGAAYFKLHPGHYQTSKEVTDAIYGKYWEKGRVLDKRIQ